jgi:hypothetical protein
VVRPRRRAPKCTRRQPGLSCRSIPAAWGPTPVLVLDGIRPALRSPGPFLPPPHRGSAPRRAVRARRRAAVDGDPAVPADGTRPAGFRPDGGTVVRRVAGRGRSAASVRTELRADRTFRGRPHPCAAARQTRRTAGPASSRGRARTPPDVRVRVSVRGGGDRPLRSGRSALHEYEVPARRPGPESRSSYDRGFESGCRSGSRMRSGSRYIPAGGGTSAARREQHMKPIRMGGHFVRGLILGHGPFGPARWRMPERSAGGRPRALLVVVAQRQRGPRGHRPRSCRDEEAGDGRRGDRRCGRGDAGRDTRPVPGGPVFALPEWKSLSAMRSTRPRDTGSRISLNIQSGWNLGGPMVKAEDSDEEDRMDRHAGRGGRGGRGFCSARCEVASMRNVAVRRGDGAAERPTAVARCAPIPSSPTIPPPCGGRKGRHVLGVAGGQPGQDRSRPRPHAWRRSSAPGARRRGRFVGRKGYGPRSGTDRCSRRARRFPHDRGVRPMRVRGDCPRRRTRPARRASAGGRDRGARSPVSRHAAQRTGRRLVGGRRRACAHPAGAGDRAITELRAKGLPPVTGSSTRRRRTPVRPNRTTRPRRVRPAEVVDLTARMDASGRLCAGGRAGREMARAAVRLYRGRLARAPPQPRLGGPAIDTSIPRWSTGTGRRSWRG